MLRSHPFSPPTKTDRERGSITLLTTVWLAATLVGVVAVARATVALNARSVAQTNADAVALVAADRGVAAAQRFADSADIDVMSIEASPGRATVTVRAGHVDATASALKPE